MVVKKLVQVTVVGLALVQSFSARGGDEQDPSIYGDLFSQARESDEDAIESINESLEIADRIDSINNETTPDTDETLLEFESKRRGSAFEGRKRLSETDFSFVPDLGTYARVKQAFEAVRDDRFMTEKVLPITFAPRRISWLYPVEGCYTRAAVAGKYLATRYGLPRPAKFFVFDKLKLTSPYSPHPDGHIFWRFHVAPMYRAMGQVWVVDPAINPHGPLSVRDWFAKMNVTEQTARVNLCSSYTYTLNSPCRTVDPVSERWGVNAQPKYLQSEWDVLLMRNLKPEDELGDTPYWKRPESTWPTMPTPAPVVSPTPPRPRP